MEKSDNRINQIIFATIVAVALFSGCGDKNMQEFNKNSESYLVSGEWKFKGHLGSYIDKISEQRILNKDSWNRIYPETEEAFRLRKDDKNYPERGEWRGEFWGKYILSVIAAAKYYHSDELKNRIAAAVKGLSRYQDENGYIGTYAHPLFLEGNNWNVWSRKYTLWGLVDAWELLGDSSILNIATKFTDNLLTEVGPGATDIVRTGNFYGMPSSSILQPMVKLYNATKNKKYLDFAEYIVAQWSQHPAGLPDILNKGLTGKPVHEWFSNVDPYKWAKGYEFTSCVEGLVELYKTTGNEQYFTAAKNIHAVLVKWERTPVGSVSFNDKFVGSAGIINTVSEICDAVYWNRLSYELFLLTGDEKYIEEIERTLYNSLLCAFNQEGTWGLRRLRMSHIHIPAHNHFLQNHQCCTDNLPRGLFQAGDVVLAQKGNNIFLTLFNEGEGEIVLSSGQVAHFKIEGDFLKDSKVIATLSIQETEKFNLKIRTPKWSNQLKILINGNLQTGESDRRWFNVGREWKNNDKIEIVFDMDVWWQTFHPAMADSLFNNTEFYKREWAAMEFKDGNNEKINNKYEHVKSLPLSDALPNTQAVTFFYGPLALSRDVRVTEGDIFSRVQFMPDTGSVSINSVSPPEGVWKTFELNFGNGQIYRFCDFSSAGNTWDNSSEFNTWCILKNQN